MKRFNFFPSIFLVALVALVLPLFTGCGDDPVDPGTPGKGLVKFVHVATAVTENIDILIDGSEFVSNRAFEAVTSYLSIEEGSHEIKIVPTGTTTALFTGNLTIEADKNYSVFMASDASDELKLIFVEDDLTAPEDGKYHIRFVNLVADSPALKVGISGTGKIDALSGVEFLQGTAFIDLDDSAPTFNIQDNTVGGTGGGGTTPLISRSFGLSTGKIYTLLAQGRLDGVDDFAAKLELITHN